MSIFDDISRTDTAPPLQNETAFGYLNRSGRVEAGRVRHNVDLWLDHYPVEHRDALIARFRSSIDDHHLSAFFELFLYELMLARKFTVVAIEPPLAHTRKSPDFLVEDSNGLRFYLEAAFATGRSRGEVGAQARLNEALAAIDGTLSPEHFLDITVQGVPTAPVSINRMRKELKRWIRGLPNGAKAENAAPFHFDEHNFQ